MKSTDHARQTVFKRKQWIVHLSVSIVFIAGGVLGLAVLTHSRSGIEKEQPPVTPPLVRTMSIQSGPFTVRIAGEGTVRPMREVNLAAQVQGRVVRIADGLADGKRFNAGDTLVRIDPADYELAVTSARARVEETWSELMMAEAESEAAKQEWQMLNGDGKVPALVAKTPQLSAASALYSAAKADLAKAVLQLERTQLKAPFRGRVSRKYVEAGEQVAPGQILADIFCVDVAEVVVPFDDESLYWFHVPGFTPGTGNGAEVLVKGVVAGRPVTWAGEVTHAEGKLDPHTRMVNVVIRVEKPYTKMPPLAPGLYVTVEIQGRQLRNTVVIPRSALRDGNCVWVIDGDNVLHFRKVAVARLQGDTAVLESGLTTGEVIAVSPLKAVTDGMTVRTGATMISPVKSGEEGGRS